jgi:signal transduction histidine kinase/CheY-like chemotaxis protein
MNASTPLAGLFADQMQVGMAYFLTALGGVAAAAAAWIVALRRRLHKQDEELRAHFAKEKELENRILQGQKLEAVGRLAGGIAHDFNNLLTVINGCSELLDTTLPPDHVSRDLVADIRRAGERAAGLTAQLLLFSRKRPINLLSINLNSAVTDAVRLLGRVLGDNVTVETKLADDLPAVKADYGLIHQIVLNLAVNSRDAMPYGGTVTIRTESKDAADRAVVRLSLADTGAGMDEETQKQVFEPFFTTKEQGKGTGLGLATVYGIVRTLGGEIHFRSAVGHGTTFEIDLPAAGASDHGDSREMRKVAVPIDDPTPLPSRGVVLLVEDDEMVRGLARRVLTRDAFHVVTAASATDAVRIARQEPQLDLLITDVVMPELSGPEVAELIRQFRPNLRVLFMSGHTPDEIRRQGLDVDAEAFVQKPFAGEALIARVEALFVKTVPELDLGPVE